MTRKSKKGIFSLINEIAGHISGTDLGERIKFILNTLIVSNILTSPRSLTKLILEYLSTLVIYVNMIIIPPTYTSTRTIINQEFFIPKIIARKSLKKNNASIPIKGEPEKNIIIKTAIYISTQICLRFWGTWATSLYSFLISHI